jgi:hypothetical protein
MIGQDAIGFHAVGEGITTSAAPLVYEPVSRVMAGGFSNGRPVQVAVLGVDLIWDDEDSIIWDDEQDMGWEV